MTTQLPEITVDRLAKPKKEGTKVKAMVDVLLSGHYAVKGFRVTDGKNGLFVAMPTAPENGNKFVEKFHPVTKEGREHIRRAIMEAFKKWEKEGSAAKEPQKEEAPAGTSRMG